MQTPEPAIPSEVPLYQFQIELDHAWLHFSFLDNDSIVGEANVQGWPDFSFLDVELENQ